MMTDICCGMAYLHVRNVMHMDLKPANILVDGDLKVKVADFGISKILNDNEQAVDNVQVC